MAGGLDVYGIVLVVAVAALFGWFFWHTAAGMIRSSRMVIELWEGRAAREKARIEHERIHGRPPLWYRAIQKILIALMIVGATWLVWTKFRGQ